MKTKHILFSTLLSAFTLVTAQAQHTLTQLWSTDGSLPIPESVFYSAQNKVLYVALIDGKAGEKDGKGGIAKV